MWQPESDQAYAVAGGRETVYSFNHSSPGMMRLMNSSNMGTVDAVSPWLGLHIIPLIINWLRVGAREETFFTRTVDMSPDRCGP